MAQNAPVYVARPSDLALLQGHYAAAKAGQSRFVVLEGALGSGKRVLVSELLRLLPSDEDVLVLRVPLTEDMDGDAAMKALYAALCGALYRDATLRGKVELILAGQLPQHGKRQQSWFQVFIDGVKKNVPEPGAEKMQLAVPADNPLAAFPEILAAISKKLTTVFEVQGVSGVHSLALSTVLDGLCELRSEGKLLAIFETDPVDEGARAWMPVPWLDLLERRKEQLQRMVMEAWTGDDVAAYCASRAVDLANPARVAELVQGRPGFVGELVDHLAAQNLLGDPLEGALLAVVPLALDESELDDPPAGTPKEGQRKYATAADADRIFHLAALLGVQFPSGLVADMAGFDRDSVDDIMDAAGDLVKEDQFHQGFGTWLYQFKRPLFRDAILQAHQSDEDKEIARRVGVFMERVLAPRGYLFMVRTARIYGEYGAYGRANIMRLTALNQEAPQTWAMIHDTVKHLTVVWPDALRRTIYGNLVERMVQNGNVEQTEALVNEALAWATAKEDRAFQAALLFAGARNDFRRGDMYRSRDRAKDAAKLYAALGEKLKQAEIENHLASIELQENNPNATLEHIRHALEHANEPPIQANAEYIRGLLARRANRSQEATEHFKKANELAGQLNMAPLALEAGFHYGEALLLGQQATKAADALARVAQMANQLQNPVRERSAAALLSQAQGQLKNFESALQYANRTLQLTQALKFEKFLPVDIYNVAYWNLALGRNSEAATLFGKARERAGGMDAKFLKDLSFNAGVALARIGERQSAEGAFSESMGHARASKDVRRFVEASENLAGLVAGRDKAAAAKLLQEALAAADQGGLKEERKGLRKRLDEIGS